MNKTKYFKYYWTFKSFFEVLKKKMQLFFLSQKNQSTYSNKGALFYKEFDKLLENLFNIPQHKYSKMIACLKNDSDLLEFFLKTYYNYTKSWYLRWDPFKTITLYYSLVRILKPTIVVETGVAHGFSTMIILKALTDNNHGTLISIDVPFVGVLELDKSPGWLVPKNLRSRWQLLIGKSQYHLPQLLQKYHQIDFFIHDSHHSFDHMLWEYHTIWSSLSKEGILVSDDVFMNLAFLEFCKENKRTPYIAMNRYGIVLKEQKWMFNSDFTSF